MKDKRIVLIVSILLVLIGGFALFKGGDGEKETGQVSPTPTASPFVNAKEPQIELELQANRERGKLVVSGIEKTFTFLEYEFIYQSLYSDSLVERGISSGGEISVPSSGKLSKELTFGVESCTTGKCHFVSEKVETDQPATLILRLLNDKSEVWELEKEVGFVKKGTIFQANFK